MNLQLQCDIGRIMALLWVINRYLTRAFIQGKVKVPKYNTIVVSLQGLNVVLGQGTWDEKQYNMGSRVRCC